MRKIISLIPLILGICIFIFGSYVSDQAMQGRQKLTTAEENMQGRRRPMIGPIRKGVAAESSQTAEKKIIATEGDIVALEVKAQWLHGSGIALFCIGLISLIISLCYRKKIH